MKTAPVAGKKLGPRTSDLGLGGLKNRKPILTLSAGLSSRVVPFGRVAEA